jgi:signal transduction histidine kinase/ActR/RegA family two-component response regulator
MLKLRIRKLHRHLLRLFCFLPLSLAAASVPPSTTVLLIHSYNDGMRWADNVTNGITNELHHRRGAFCHLRIEYMDGKNITSDSYLQAFRELLAIKYKNVKIDVVVCSDDLAFRFVLDHRAELFPGVPLVFCGVNYFDPAMLNGQDNVTGVVEKLDILDTLQTALQLHPETTRVVIINDRTTTGLANRLLFEKQVRPHLDPQVQLEFWDSVAMPDLLDNAQRLTPGTLVLLLSFTQDAAGKTFTYAESIDLISRACPVPIYGIWTFFLGRGIVGGKLTSGVNQGREAGRLVNRILEGESAADIPVVVEIKNRFAFDYLQLQRFGIHQDNLPAGSPVINIPKSYFKVPKGTAAITLILLLVLGLTVLVLIINMFQRIRAERQRARLESHMLQAQKLESLGVMAGGIAHDFNNLLMGILGNASLATMELPPDSPAHKSIEGIQASAQRAAKLTNQLLAYSGRGRLITQRTNLTKLIKEMVPLLERAVSKRVAINFDLDAHLPLVDTDQAQMRQVVINLVSNASEAIDETAGENGTISVRTGKETLAEARNGKLLVNPSLPPGTYIFLEVTDDGCGMPRNVIDKVFDPFYTTKFTGRGLGLAAVLGIVRGHHGGVQISSQPRKGTVVRVLFPPAAEAATEQPAALAEVSAEEFKGAGTVLVVDDEETVRRVCSTMLERYGFSVASAANGREALQLLEHTAEKPVVIILDLTMPLMDGIQTLSELRKRKYEIPVILSSGFTEYDATRKFGGTGFQGFIQKPYVPQDLVQEIRRVMMAAPSRNTQAQARGSSYSNT